LFEALARCLSQEAVMIDTGRQPGRIEMRYMLTGRLLAIKDFQHLFPEQVQDSESDLCIGREDIRNAGFSPEGIGIVSPSAKPCSPGINSGSRALRV
jgi:hypothetical protein